MSAPDLLVAARQRFLASDAYALLDSSDQIGAHDDGSPWVFASLDPETGLPYTYGADQASVTFYLRANEWNRTTNTARSPRLGVVVFVEGDRSSPDSEWLAREVAEAVIGVFDDPHGVSDPAWTDEVRVFHCRWSGELSVGSVENMPGCYRADFDFEIGTA